jgi:hypothetical protein
VTQAPRIVGRLHPASDRVMRNIPASDALL